MCIISGFRGDVDEICALLGCYAVYIDNSLPTFRTNYQSRLLGYLVYPGPWRWDR